MEDLKNKWIWLDLIYYKDEHQEINKLNLLHPEDVKVFQLNQPFSFCKCIKVENDYLTIRNKTHSIRIMKEAIKKIMPTPKFIWNDKVCQITKPEIEAVIDDFYWNHKDEKYFYQISVGGKRKSNRYDENDLKLVSSSAKSPDFEEH